MKRSLCLSIIAGLVFGAFALAGCGGPKKPETSAVGGKVKGDDNAVATTTAAAQAKGAGICAVCGKKSDKLMLVETNNQADPMGANSIWFGVDNDNCKMSWMMGTGKAYHRGEWKIEGDKIIKDIAEADRKKMPLPPGMSEGVYYGTTGGGKAPAAPGGVNAPSKK